MFPWSLEKHENLEFQFFVSTLNLKKMLKWFWNSVVIILNYLNYELNVSWLLRDKIIHRCIGTLQ